MVLIFIELLIWFRYNSRGKIFSFNFKISRKAYRIRICGLYSFNLFIYKITKKTERICRIYPSVSKVQVFVSVKIQTNGDTPRASDSNVANNKYPRYREQSTLLISGNKKEKES